MGTSISSHVMSSRRFITRSQGACHGCNMLSLKCCRSDPIPPSCGRHYTPAVPPWPRYDRVIPPVRACDDPVMTVSWPIPAGSLSDSNSVGYISGNQRKTATGRVPNATVWLAAIEEMTDSPSCSQCRAESWRTAIRVSLTCISQDIYYLKKNLSRLRLLKRILARQDFVIFSSGMKSDFQSNLCH